LEVGCGTGVINEELKRWEFRQFGLDINIHHLKLAVQHTASTHFTQADAHQIPFEDNCFDAVLCHFLLMWVFEPKQVIAEMARVARSGGSVLVLAEPDYGGRIDYPPELEILGKWQTKALQIQGADPFMGRKLAGLLNGAYLKAIEVGVLGGQWEGPPDWDAWELEWQVFQSDMMVAVDHFSSGTLKDLKIFEKDMYLNGERILFVPTFYAWGIVP
jgi:SAM-dependent methyltransferase